MIHIRLRIHLRKLKEVTFSSSDYSHPSSLLFIHSFLLLTEQASKEPKDVQF